MTRIAVCALTMRRPVGLARLLESLARIEVPDDVDLRVLIVDNDPEQSAVSIVRDAQPGFPFPLAYVAEPRRGIPYGRNTAVTSSGDADFVCFLDDDEYAEPGWLAELLRVQQAYGADVVAGPVLPDYEDGIAPWVIEGRFFEPLRRPTGTVRPSAESGNVLVARRVFDQGLFAEWMGLTGGEDTHFFTRARLLGFKIVQANEAIAHELIPVSRANPRWLIRRQFRRGTTLSQCLRDLEDSPRRRVLRIGRAGIHVFEAIGLFAKTPFRGRIAFVQSVQRLALAAGLVAGLWNIRYDEYKELHGS